jgi:hypothetical protein
MGRSSERGEDDERERQRLHPLTYRTPRHPLVVLNYWATQPQSTPINPNQPQSRPINLGSGQGLALERLKSGRLFENFRRL